MSVRRAAISPRGGGGVVSYLKIQPSYQRCVCTDFTKFWHLRNFGLTVPPPPSSHFFSGPSTGPSLLRYSINQVLYTFYFLNIMHLFSGLRRALTHFLFCASVFGTIREEVFLQPGTRHDETILKWAWLYMHSENYLSCYFRRNYIQISTFLLHFPKFYANAILMAYWLSLYHKLHNKYARESIFFGNDYDLTTNFHVVQNVFNRFRVETDLKYPFSNTS